MYKLSAADAGFLYGETPSCPMHVASVQIMELPEGSTEDQFIEGLKTFLAARRHLVPYLTNRLQEIPFGLDHPVWVRDENFAIGNHVYRVDVPAPGGRNELERTVARLHAQPLERTRPLWDLAVLCGLENGHVAYYSRVHHACLDGLAAQAATMTLMDTSPVGPEVEPSSPEIANRASRYNALQLLVSAWQNFAEFQVDQITRAPARAAGALRLWQRGMDPSRGFGATAMRAPSTRFNRPIDAARTYAVGELPLNDVKALGKSFGATLNDVFLAICGGGLRRYFARLGENPAEPLLAGCPVSLRKPGDHSLNNQVTMMQVDLGTNIDDPVRRLDAVAASTRIAKSVTADAADLLPSDVALPGLPGLLGGLAETSERLGLANPPFNVVVSNVPGPRETLYSNGAKMLTHYPVSIPAHGTGVNITVQSYTDALYFGITACASVLPDADRLRDDMIAEYDAFRFAVLGDPVCEVDLPDVAAFKLPPVDERLMAAEQVVEPTGADWERVA